MFSSIFKSDTHEQNFHPVTSAFQPGEFLGELQARDKQWTCAGGFATETQIFYNFNADGTFVMFQLVHASVGVWFPTIQFVVHIYDPNTKERIWSSTNVSNFTTACGANDKMSCKADEFSVTHKSPAEAHLPETYTIAANPSRDVQVSAVVSRALDVPGFKFGGGEHGGMSYFGKDTAKADGYVVHRFWPRTRISGHVVYKGKAITLDGPGMMVHAIQGMRPNLVAARWNFAHFQSDEAGGVSAIQMEFTTTPAYGPKGSGSGGVVVNLGSVVVGGKLALVTGETRFPGTEAAKDAPVQSRARHIAPVKDKETGYLAPTGLEFVWRGPGLGDDKETVAARLETTVGPPDAPIGLVQKVDVLGEVPSVVKGVVSYVANAKPYIYQWVNPAKLTLQAKGRLPDGAEELTINGWLNTEATFISEL